jgi:hygromycin-B 7''-O-kinase
MHWSEPLLPPIITRADYRELRTRADMWHRAMQIICQRYALPAARLVRFGDGTDPADGSNVVFAVGKHHVIKLFPPYYQRLFEAELSVARDVFEKLRIATPEIYADGTLDGWPYLVMSRLQGVYLVDVWHTLEHANELSLVCELAEILAHLHTLPTHPLPLLDANWPEIVATRVSACVQRHREQEVPEYWLQQIPDYLAQAAPLYPPTFTPAIVSGDIHEYHLLVKQEGARWQLSGFFDFDDAMLGFYEYDLAAAGLFMMASRPRLLRSFLLTYGYAEADLDEALRYRLMAYTLLHRYRPFNYWLREALAKQACSTLEEVAHILYAFA